MQALEQSVRDIAQRHQISQASAQQLVDGLLRTGGGQVQFNIPEFGGFGQWMPGMVMAGDMFNHALKQRVDAVCSDIARQVQSGGITYFAASPAPAGSNLSMNPSAQRNGWPTDLGAPSTSGSQNDLRYAWFASTRRLAVDLGRGVWVYDTGNHQIGGVSQQQSGSGMTLTFTSQHGVVNLASLPVVSKP